MKTTTTTTKHTKSTARNLHAPEIRALETRIEGIIAGHRYLGQHAEADAVVVIRDLVRRELALTHP